MKPDRPGIWEWFDDKGERHLMSVFDMGTPGLYQYLRVYWWGGYYDVTYEGVLPNGKQSEWPDRWGKRVCDLDGPMAKKLARDNKLYDGPTPEMIRNIRQKYS